MCIDVPSTLRPLGLSVKSKFTSDDRLKRKRTLSSQKNIIP